MKKKLAGVLAAVMLLGAPMTAFAAEDLFDATIEIERSSEQITVTVPDNNTVYENTNTTLTIPYDGEWEKAAVKHEDGTEVVVDVTEDGITFPVTAGGTYTITEADESNTGEGGGNTGDAEGDGSGGSTEDGAGDSGESSPGGSAPGEPAPSPSSGGSSSGSSRYAISADKSANGSISVSPTSAAKGKTVTVTTDPDEGYALETLTVTDKNGKAIAVADNGDGTYSFTMPAGSVRIQAAFEPLQETVLPFEDVAKDSTFHDAIAWAYETGYMNGKTPETFQPDGKISRQQVWMILARMSGADPANMAEAKAWAAAAGISDGSNSGGAVTRQQLAAMLYRYEQSCGGGFTGLWAFPLRYEDADQVAGYAYEALCWCTMKGVMSGYADNTLRPQNTATRAHMAAMLMRFCQIER